MCIRDSRKTLRGLWATLKDIFGHKSIFVFMLAYFFYIEDVYKRQG